MTFNDMLVEFVESALGVLLGLGLALGVAAAIELAKRVKAIEPRRTP